MTPPTNNNNGPGSSSDGSLPDEDNLDLRSKKRRKPRRQGQRYHAAIIRDDSFLATDQVLKALRASIFPTDFISLVMGGPQIFKRILDYKPPEIEGQQYANEYPFSHQEQLILKQNSEKLIRLEGTRAVLLGPAYAEKDLLLFSLAGAPISADIVDISREFREISKEIISGRGKIHRIRTHAKSYMAGPNSVWDRQYYEREILRGDYSTPVIIISFGHGRFNHGITEYEESLMAMRNVMRPQDRLIEGIELTQDRFTLLREYNSAKGSVPGRVEAIDLWERLGKLVLAGTVGRILGCTNLDLTKVHRQKTVFIKSESGCQAVRLTLATYDHPPLKYRELDKSSIGVPRRLGSFIHYLYSPKPTEQLLREIIQRQRFALVKDELSLRDKLLRVKQQLLLPPGLKPDVVIMQAAPV